MTQAPPHYGRHARPEGDGPQPSTPQPAKGAPRDYANSPRRAARHGQVAATAGVNGHTGLSGQVPVQAHTQPSPQPHGHQPHGHQAQPPQARAFQPVRPTPAAPSPPLRRTLAPGHPASAPNGHPAQFANGFAPSAQSGVTAPTAPARPSPSGVDSLIPDAAPTTLRRRARHAPAGSAASGPVADPVLALQHHPSSPRGRHATSYGQNYGRVVGWTLLGSLVPGAGLIAAGRRVTGWLVLVTFTLAGLGLAALAVLRGPVALAATLVSQPDLLLIAAGALAAVLVLWAAVVLGTHSALRRFSHLGVAQRVVCGLLVTSLIAMVGIPTAKAGSYLMIARETVQGIFTAPAKPPTGVRPKPAAVADPWANTPRVNVLLIGSDAGADRIGIRPDTLILASINTRTGDTVLFSLPRNLQKVPFPRGSRQAVQYPNGYSCTDAAGVPQCLLNAFWTFGEENWKTYYADQPTAFDAGLRATEDAVQEVTGLHVDQYAMLNLRGFMQFVDAVGGITVNVYQRLPIGGSSENRVAREWIEPGMNQHLDGYHSLWYARSRWSTDDYDRMRRQRCVIGAVVKQADPARMALAFPQIAAAAKNNIITDIPLADLNAWVQLTQKVQGAKVRSLPFTATVVDTENPDFIAIRSLVSDALNAPTDAAPSPSVVPSPTPSHRTHSTPQTSPSVDQQHAKEAQDVAQVC